MSSHLNFALIPGLSGMNRSGRLAEEERASAPTVKRAPSGTAIEPRTPSQLFSFLTGASSQAFAAEDQGQQPAANIEERLSKVAFDQLRVNDQLLIQTVHSTYIFLVLDPARRCGLVVGGVFGDYATTALIEWFPVTTDECLHIGMRVRFKVQSSLGNKLVTTSAITELIHRRREGESPC